MRRGLKIFIIVLAVLLIMCGAALYTYNYLLTAYRVDEVYVEGNVHYTADEIKEFVMNGKYGDNSLYLSYRYKGKEITDIPFVETISVSILSKNSIKISVYEKALAGFVEYLGKNIYFDKDGIVVEVSEVRTKGIPQVVGIDFDYIVLHEKLPVKDEELFMRVLNITKLCSKYGVDAQKMLFSKFGDITLYIDRIAISLGKEKDIDIKIMNLPPILTHLVGKSGTLRMEDYDESTKRVSFENEE